MSSLERSRMVDKGSGVHFIHLFVKRMSYYFSLLFFRYEIEATLERLKKLERDLSTKEQELKEREQRLKMWERKLIEQSSSPVSPSLVLLHFDAHVCWSPLEARTSAEVGRKSVEVKGGMRSTQEHGVGQCVVLVAAHSFEV